MQILIKSFYLALDTGDADKDTDAGADGMDGADGTVDDDAVNNVEGEGGEEPGSGGDEVVEPELDMGKVQVFA